MGPNEFIKKIQILLATLLLLVICPSAFAGWDEWQARYNKEINSCSMGIVHRESKDSWADASLIIIQQDDFVILQVHADEWITAENNAKTDLLVSFFKNGTFQESFDSLADGVKQLDISNEFAIFLPALAEDEYIKFKPVKGDYRFILTVPLKSKKSNKALKDFVKCMQESIQEPR